VCIARFGNFRAEASRYVIIEDSEESTTVEGRSYVDQTTNDKRLPGTSWQDSVIRLLNGAFAKIS
jgi:hypothetical protein